VKLARSRSWLLGIGGIAPALRGGAMRALLLAAFACGNPAPGDPARTAGDPGAAPGATTEPAQAVTPPFAVRGELDGLLLVWFDADGAHTAPRRADIPEARRSAVRVDSLGVPPEKRLDPEHVYVADVRQPRADGSYPVHLRTRAWFEAQVEAARGAVAVAQPAPEATAGVTVYMASWCGACRSAAAYMRSRNVAFAEKDIEKDAQANAEMLQKARAAGKTPRGVPVIDFRGHIVLGFDQQQLDHLIDKYKAL
jgi:glutaredoxin